MINIWDDHETANDSWATGAKGHQPEEGDWETRKNNALKAYFEWIPLRGKADQPIYRDFQFGELVNLMMLDTRLCCRSELAKSPEDLKKKSAEATLVGPAQLNWIFEGVKRKAATWNVFGNQVLMSKIYREDGKPRPDYDQWNGYPRERGLLKSFLAEQKRENFLVLTGNLHNARHFAWLDSENELSGDTLVHEIVTGSISSGGFAEKGEMSSYEATRAKLAKHNPHLQWFDLIKHGFVVVEFTQQEARVQWYFVSTLLKKEYKLEKAYEIVLPVRK